MYPPINFSALYRRAKRILRDTHGWGVPRRRPKVLRSFAHDEGAFTQGLAYDRGFIYESTGLEHASSLRRVDACSGEVLRSIAVPNDWAEGLAIDGDRLIQLSWKREVATVYSLPDLERIGSYNYEGEGWGLTWAPGGFIMTDGSPALQFRNSDFELREVRKVTNWRIGVRRLNDLAYADGKIYANLWYRDDIVCINADTGTVEAVVDCSELKSAAAPQRPEHVLNGIAHCPERSSFVVTGKCWRFFFEISVDPR